MGGGGGGGGGPPFKYGTNIVNRGLKVLFFDLFAMLRFFYSAIFC